MREDTTISFMNPAFRDELSELVREGRSESYGRPWKRSWGPFWRNMRPIVTRVVGVRLSATATCLRGRC